ncbi:terminase small subunit [Mesorhizobium sp. BR1-1-16]|uniref:terminase small subunit n=1 Tax=Mesorhizobium sp. BR1-1-16 TaxID=2876653 RepID=UPI001CCFE95A|nr:terminase small subunit [Mesorhizobium sp. BR1-1-16]MBZ9939153.1 terminase small subunit [Mesorhizobium sp. BR1-1-16]
MSVLKNPRHEAFAQALAKGQSATEAYQTAGYAESRSAASRLSTNVNVVARVADIQEKAATKVGVTIERVVTELAKIGFANMLDYMRAGPDGDPYLDFSRLTEGQAAALAEVTVEDFKDGRGDDARDVRRVKFKLHDKRAALVDLGKHLGMFKDRVEVSGPNGGPIQSEVSARDILAGKLARLAGRGGTTGDTGRSD